jgi:hypothetical protein
VTNRNIVVQHDCFGEDNFGTYSTQIKLFWDTTTNFTTLYVEVLISPWPYKEGKATAKKLAVYSR